MQKTYLDSNTVRIVANVGLDLLRNYDNYRGKDICCPIAEEAMWSEVPELVEQETVEDSITYFVELVQAHIDGVARTRNYDSILSLCTYANSTNDKFRKEGQAGIVWRDSVWSTCYKILAEVQAGARTPPSDIISELPVFTWGD